MADWHKIEQRGKVDDRRSRPGRVLGGAGIGFAIIALALTYLTGGDPSQVIDAISGVAPEQGVEESGEYVGEDLYEVFVSEVTGSANELWSREFAEAGLAYQEPTTVLFRQGTESGCGGADSASGPHYCPADQTIYLDETFFDELTSRFGARGGEVAEAYVLAHEMGHHVQTLLGISSLVKTNEDSIALELQADCFAGVWAYYVRDMDIITLEEVEQAIDAAAAVGDDRIQRSTTGRVNPETWTHGSSEQRMRWFMTGFETGDPVECDTGLN